MRHLNVYLLFDQSLRIRDWHVDDGAGYLPLHWHHHDRLHRHLRSSWLFDDWLLLFLNQHRFRGLGVLS
jgi:hypothetical protein